MRQCIPNAKQAGKRINESFLAHDWLTSVKIYTSVLSYCLSARFSIPRISNQKWHQYCRYQYLLNHYGLDYGTVTSEAIYSAKFRNKWHNFYFDVKRFFFTYEYSMGTISSTDKTIATCKCLNSFVQMMIDSKFIKHREEKLNTGYSIQLKSCINITTE